MDTILITWQVIVSGGGGEGESERRAGKEREVGGGIDIKGFRKNKVAKKCSSNKTPWV